MAESIPPQLPHVIIEEPKRSPVAFLAISIVSLMLFTIPVGVYLTLQNQNPASQAEQAETTNPEVGYFIEFDKDQVGVGSVFPVRVVVRSDSEAANLFVIEALYPQNLLEIVKIDVLPDEDTGYFSLPNARVVKQNFNNLSGALTLIIGVPDPGVKTNFSERKFGIATIYFRSKDIGEAEITFEDQTSILSNKSKKNILPEEKNDFKISVSSEVPTENALADETIINNKVSELKILTPNGGETFRFGDDIPVRWNLDDKKMPSVSINLYMNGKLFGILAKQLPNKKEFIFRPSTALQPLFATDSNAFQIEVEGRSSTGDNIIAKGDGPFGIYTSENLVYEASPSATLKDGAKDITGDNQINFEDLSELFSLFGKSDEGSLKADFSADKAINDIDLWIIKRGLITNGVIDEN